MVAKRTAGKKPGHNVETGKKGFQKTTLVKPVAPTAKKAVLVSQSILSQSVANRLKSAESDSTPQKDLLELIKDPNTDVRGELVQRSDLTPKMLEALSYDKNWYVKLQVAYNERSLPSTLSRLVNASYSETRAAVAGNGNTLLKDLATLSNDRDSYVRQVLAGNPRTPNVAQLKLAKDNDWRVLLALASQRDLSDEVLNTLLDTTSRKKEEEDLPSKYYVYQRIILNRRVSSIIRAKARELTKSAIQPVR